MDYYANSRKDSNKGMCSPFVEKAVSEFMTDDNGQIVTIVSFIDEGDSTNILTMDEIKEQIRAEIHQYVVDLIKVAEI